VYINIVGGLRLDEPAADLSIALALYSSLTDKPVEEKLIAFGEIGLGGEIRNVSHILQRISEAQRLGFERCLVPEQALKEITKGKFKIEIAGINSLRQAFKYLT